jgi:L-iditol 2-dehydrogenase
MRTVVLNDGQPCRIIETDTPRAFDNFAVVKIVAAPLCTEYRKYHSGELCKNLGHEASGIVVDALPGSRVKPGDRVIVMPQYPCGECDLCETGDYIHCQNISDPLQKYHFEYGTGTLADHIIKPDWLLIPIPDDITFDEASMACCGLGPALGAGKALDISEGQNVLITGAGPVGLGAVVYCVFHKANVFVCTKNEYRSRLAKDIGATATLTPGENFVTDLASVTGVAGVDSVIECTGNSKYISVALNSVKRKGKIAFIGESANYPFHISNDLLRKGLTIHGIWHWNMNYTHDMLDLIRHSRSKINKMITHVMPLDKIEDSFRLQLTGNCGKVVIHP